MKIVANGIHIEVEDSGAGRNQHGVERPVVLLIMGLGMQLIAWPPALVDALVQAGYRVIRHDNRDIGLSQNFDALGNPNLVWAALKYRLGLPVRSPYRLHDMAADALGVLDALKVQRAHVVGVSMGGMIAQRLAIAAPERVQTLTSIMSSSGARGLPEARPDVVRALIRRPGNAPHEALVNYYVNFFKLIASPAFPVAESELRERIQFGIRRGAQPQGPSRQTLAIIADTTRANELKGIAAPTLVLHGKADPLVPFACGEDTARRIPGATLVGIDGMGHDLAPGVVERILPPMLGHIGRQAA
jgi:pimeloyl-ACP methyl ester carboxylesterase